VLEDPLDSIVKNKKEAFIMNDNEYETGKRHEVRIHIDREPYESPNPTTGEALYRLGHVPSHRELFKEVEGDHEDVIIPNDGTEVDIKQDEHFYSEIEVTIVVNARQKVVTKKVLSFDEIVLLAFDPPPSGPNIIITVTYWNGPRKNPDGSLYKGKSITIKEGMVFNVTATDNS